MVVPPAKAGAVSALTTMSKVSLTEAVPSLAVTFTISVPVSVDCGVPAKSRGLLLVLVKVSHEGSAVSSDLVAV